MQSSTLCCAAAAERDTLGSTLTARGRAMASSFEAAALTTVRIDCEKQLNGAATMSGNDLFISRLSDRI